MLDFDVAILHPTEPLKSFSKGRDPSLCLQVVFGEPMQKNDAPHTLVLLRTSNQRPSRRRAGEKRDEIAPSHARHGLPPSHALPPPIIPAGDRHGAVGLPHFQPAGGRVSRSLGQT